MTKVQRFRLWLARKALGGQSFSVGDPALSTILARDGRTYSGKAVDQNTALQVSAAWTCIRLLAETIGYLPWGFYQDDGNGNSSKIDHDLSAVLMGTPNIDMTPVDLKEAWITNLALMGASYSLLMPRGDGSPMAIYPVATDCAKKTRDRETGRVLYEFLERGRWEPYPAERVLDMHGFGFDGFTGLSPIAYARQALGLSLATEEFQARFFSNGATPSWLISIPEWLPDNQREIAKQNIKDIWSGLNNSHRVALLEGGMKAVPGTMPLADAQFLELKNATLNDICRIFRIPPHLAGDLDRSTNNNIEHQSLEFVMYTLQPYLTRIEAAIKKKMLKPDERAKIFLRFNVEGLLRADAAARAELYASGVQNGYLNRNEVRALEGRNRVDGLDEYTVQSNLVPLDQLAKLVAKQMEPKPAPVVGAGANAPAAPAPAKAGDTFILIPERAVTVNTPEVKVAVGGPDVRVAAPRVETPVTVVSQADDGAAAQLGEVIGRFGELVDGLRKENAKETRVVRDASGAITGTRKVASGD